MEYFEKLETNPYEDLRWNIPEQKQGSVNIIGGNEKNFHTEIKVAEFIMREYPLKDVGVVLPNSLKTKIPVLPNFVFLPATDTGSFDESQELIDVFGQADSNLVLGDLSKNSVTGRAVAGACKSSEKLTLITRDAADLIIENSPERLLMNEHLVFFVSMVQLQKLLRAVYYPKMLLMSQSLVQVVDILHKFTLSYPVSIVTLHNGQVLVAKNGIVKALPLEHTGYSPITFWNGELPARLVAMNLFSPNKFIEASVCAMFNN